MQAVKKMLMLMLISECFFDGLLRRTDNIKKKEGEDEKEKSSKSEKDKDEDRKITNDVRKEE